MGRLHRSAVDRVSGGDIEDSGGGPRARTPPCGWMGWEKGRPTESGFFLLQMELCLCPWLSTDQGRGRTPGRLEGLGGHGPTPTLLP